ncbi:MAG TPA: hypothetical protein DDY16_05565 [Tenacibaculum sp.]|nr:hypothetical protein [Tenacibaculum sp.]
METVQDYIRYDITPPEELLEAYYRIKNRKLKDTVNTGAFTSSNGVSEQMEVVDDAMEMEETVIEATETDEAEAIEIEEIIEYTEEEEIVEDIPFAIIEEVPTFPSCSSFSNAERKACLHREISAIVQNNFAKDIANQLALPGGSKRIFVRFKIGVSGEIHSIMVRAPHEKLKQEAIRVVKLIPRLFPGRQSGRPVEMSYTLPITISVDGETMVNANVVRPSARNNGITRQHTNVPKYKETLQVE